MIYCVLVKNKNEEDDGGSDSVSGVGRVDLLLVYWHQHVYRPSASGCNSDCRMGVVIVLVNPPLSPSA